MVDFDITSVSKEDGKEDTYHTSFDKALIIERLSKSTGIKQGEIVDMLTEGKTVSTCFYHYKKETKEFK